ncbi:MAG: calcium-binding protein, partial [Albidovulum sp.]|uniref:calcium-binding protein n=1 Tax=Albidovulum sp. TaxID=1872424 RepID=UPI003C834E3F
VRDRSVADQKAAGYTTITGTEQAENYFHSLGDGSYTIHDYDPGKLTATDVFVFTDVNASDVTVQRLQSDPNDVVLTLSNGEQITFENELHTSYDYGVESIQFADGTTWDLGDLLTAPIVDDTLVYA